MLEVAPDTPPMVMPTLTSELVSREGFSETAEAECEIAQANREAPHQCQEGQGTGEDFVAPALPEGPFAPLPRTISSPAIHSRERLVRVLVGIDFGTKNTKVAYSVIGGMSQEVTPLIFRSESDDECFCIPSVAAFTSQDELLFGERAEAVVRNRSYYEGLRNMKTLLAGRYSPEFLDVPGRKRFEELCARELGSRLQCPIESLVAVFLAHVMDLTRRRLAEEPRLGGRDFDISFACCMPIHYRRSEYVKIAFERVLALAHHLSLEFESDLQSSKFERALEFADKHWPDVRFEREAPENRVYFVDESTAQASSYFSSQGRRDGAHALIDFGAGTTDITIYYLENVKQPDEKQLILSSVSIPQGAARVEDQAVRLLQERGVTPTPQKVFQAIRRVRDGDADFLQHARREIWDLFVLSCEAWRRAYGRENMARQGLWDSSAGVHVFRCGGASRNPLIREYFCHSWYDWDGSRLKPPELRWGPYNLADLPQPREQFYSNRHDGQIPYMRVAVAVGMAIQNAASPDEESTIRRVMQRFGEISENNRYEDG